MINLQKYHIDVPLGADIVCRQAAVYKDIILAVLRRGISYAYPPIAAILML